MKIVLVALLLVALANAHTLHYANSHAVSSDVSKQTAESIKSRIITAIPLFKNQTQAKILLDDLNQSDDSKRTLKSLDVDTAAEIFAVFGMRIPEGSDVNKDGKISGDELKSFNKIWQSFVAPKA